MRKLVKWLLFPGIIIKRSIQVMHLMLPNGEDFRRLVDCLKLPRGKFSCMLLWRKQLSPEPRHLLGNLMVGLAITILLHSFQGVALLSEIEEKSVDWMVGLYKGASTDDMAFPLGWIDIDDKTYEEWKAPLFVPRDMLARLMSFALRSNPKILLIDVDLAKRRHQQELDQPIIDLLQEYNQHCNVKPLFSDLDCPPIVFSASLHQSESEHLVQRKSYLDDLVDKSKHLFWASPSFDKDADCMTRRWRLWDVVCLDEKPVALPSFQLLAANLLTNDTETAYKNLSCLKSFLPKTCVGVPDQDANTICDFILWSKSIGKKRQRMDLSWDVLARRIRYIIPWQTNPGQFGGKPIMIPDVKTYADQNRLLLSWLPAYAIPGNTKSKGLFDDKNLQIANALRDRVVIIGGSFREGRDLHKTPLGEMPGVLIIMNALHSLVQHNELKKIEPHWIVIIEIGLIVLMSFFFTMWNAFLAKIISSVVIIALLLPLSVICFGYGLWLDFALPLLGVSIHEFIADIEETRSQSRNISSTESAGKDGDKNV